MLRHRSIAGRSSGVRHASAPPDPQPNVQGDAPGQLSCCASSGSGAPLNSALGFIGEEPLYARYVRSRVGTEGTCYEFRENISLFGCNKGFIPWLLRFKVPTRQEEPYMWHINVVSELGENAEYPNSTLLIDLKPKQNKTNLSLYEVIDVWGYSLDGWTPILLRLNGLFVDEEPSTVERKSFVRNDRDIDGPIHEFLYLNGSVANGKLIGSWAAPPASPTNAALLWPNTLKYFAKCIRDATPDILAP